MDPFVGPIVIAPTTKPTWTLVPTVTRTVVPTGTPRAGCPGDANGDGVVTIDELIRAVNASLDGCPSN